MGDKWLKFCWFTSEDLLWRNPINLERKLALNTRWQPPVIGKTQMLNTKLIQRFPYTKIHILRQFTTVNTDVLQHSIYCNKSAVDRLKKQHPPNCFLIVKFDLILNILMPWYKIIVMFHNVWLTVCLSVCSSTGCWLSVCSFLPTFKDIH